MSAARTSDPSPASAVIPAQDRAAGFVLHLVPEPSDIPATIRLRRLLKLAGRYLGLKCIDVKEIK